MYVRTYYLGSNAGLVIDPFDYVGPKDAGGSVNDLPTYYVSGWGGTTARPDSSHGTGRASGVPRLKVIVLIIQWQTVRRYFTLLARSDDAESQTQPNLSANEEQSEMEALSGKAICRQGPAC